MSLLTHRHPQTPVYLSSSVTVAIKTTLIEPRKVLKLKVRVMVTASTTLPEQSSLPLQEPVLSDEPYAPRLDHKFRLINESWLNQVRRLSCEVCRVKRWHSAVVSKLSPSRSLIGVFYSNNKNNLLLVLHTNTCLLVKNNNYDE